MFVLDSSVTMAWCFEDQGNAYTEEVLDSLKHEKAMVPELWCQEITNVLLVAERKKKIQATASGDFIYFLSKLPIQIFDSKSPKIEEDLLNLGRNFQLSAYDTVYLKLAIDLGIPLATRDDALVKACHKRGVEIFTGH